MDTTTFEIDTGGDFAVVDLTDRVARWVRGRGDGLCHLLALHATAGLGLMETGSGSEQDARTVLARLLPEDDGVYRHRHGSPGHGRDHVLPLFVSPSLTLPVSGGQPVLGTWQSVVLVDPNVDNARRRVHASFLAST
ncbi:MAG TPA: YjbQ family protein [Euzebyales bacterium]|nr:YjbQ family protein [Euzebyales bacterium]